MERILPSGSLNQATLLPSGVVQIPRFWSWAKGYFSGGTQVQKIEQGSFGGAADYRNHRGSVEGSGIHPAAVAASDGLACDASGEGAVGGSGRPAGSGKTLRGLRREQENDSARVSGGNKNEFRQVAATTSAASWAATAGFGGEGDGSGFGGGLQQSECVHIHVPEAAWNNTDAVFGRWKWAAGADWRLSAKPGRESGGLLRSE